MHKARSHVRYAPFAAGWELWRYLQATGKEQRLSYTREVIGHNSISQSPQAGQIPRLSIHTDGPVRTTNSSSAWLACELLWNLLFSAFEMV